MPIPTVGHLEAPGNGSPMRHGSRRWSATRRVSLPESTAERSTHESCVSGCGARLQSHRSSIVSVSAEGPLTDTVVIQGNPRLLVLMMTPVVVYGVAVST